MPCALIIHAALALCLALVSPLAEATFTAGGDRVPSLNSQDHFIVKRQYGGGGGGCPGTPALPTSLRVVAIAGKYLIAGASGNPNSGFLIDFLEAIKTQTGLPYSVTVWPDFNYSDKDQNGSYNGSLIGALINNQADLAGADIFNRVEAESVIDFLSPIGLYTLEVLANSQFGLNGVQYLTVFQDNIDVICDSKNATVQAICNNLLAFGSGAVVTDDVGLAKVLSGKFAYIQGPATVGPAVTANPGKLFIVGDLFSITFGFAVQQGSPLREVLNRAILQITVDGTLQGIFNKNGITDTTP